MNLFQQQMTQAITAFQQRNPRAAYQLLVDTQYTAVDDIDLHVLALTAARLADGWEQHYGLDEIDGVRELSFLELADDVYRMLDMLWQETENGGTGLVSCTR